MGHVFLPLLVMQFRFQKNRDNCRQSILWYLCLYFHEVIKLENEKIPKKKERKSEHKIMKKNKGKRMKIIRIRSTRIGLGCEMNIWVLCTSSGSKGIVF